MSEIPSAIFVDKDDASIGELELEQEQELKSSVRQLIPSFQEISFKSPTDMHQKAVSTIAKNTEKKEQERCPTRRHSSFEPRQLSQTLKCHDAMVDLLDYLEVEVESLQGDENTFLDWAKDQTMVSTDDDGDTIEGEQHGFQESCPGFLTYVDSDSEEDSVELARNQRPSLVSNSSISHVALLMELQEQREGALGNHDDQEKNSTTPEVWNEYTVALPPVIGDDARKEAQKHSFRARSFVRSVRRDSTSSRQLKRHTAMAIRNGETSETAATSSMAASLAAFQNDYNEHKEEYDSDSA